MIPNIVHLILSIFDGLTNRSLTYIARMFIRAFDLRHAFDRSILDFRCCNNMGFIHPQTIAVSLVAIHFAVGG